MRNLASIERHAGVTPSERYLQSLCERTFLSLWSYAGIYRDQQTAKKGDGKEICDLLVVFGKHVIIFSDKACTYPISNDAALDWRRWFRKAIWKSAEQTWGAERWIREHSDRLFIDRKCTKKFPLDLPPPDKIVFHLIVVAHGVSPLIRKIHGGSGSLLIDSSSSGAGAHCQPFTIGDLESNRTFVHVFDEETITLLMQARDTVSDFVAYLDKRKDLLRGQRAVMAAGEEDLLAIYLRNLNAKGEHDFVFPFAAEENASCVLVPEGEWTRFERHPQRIAQLKADQISYSWDALIETFNKHTLAGTHFTSVGNGFRDSERVRRFLAREPRFKRRHLALMIHDMLRNTPPDFRCVRVLPAILPGDPHYVFVLFPGNTIIQLPYDQYRNIRIEFLRACCMTTKMKMPTALDIVGIATESGSEKMRSEDSMYLDAREWTSEMEKEAIDLQRELKILESPERVEGKLNEFPRFEMTSPKKVGRNSLCPCGSGKKYKKCHLL